MKYLIVGLGNIGDEYRNTRHNIGFRIVDAFADDRKAVFQDSRYGSVAYCRVKNAELVLLKPSTFMNLSGTAVRYWLQKENISVENLLVLVDDLALPFGTLRLRLKGSDGGHNGLKNIQECILTQNYSRLRFGIGSDFARGAQVGYVLGEWSTVEVEAMPDKLHTCCEIIKSFCLQGVERTMNLYNKK
ncbi:MAG: aminoacyl-tRNA hydrolase [Paludibacter sp.]|nr:aminoacyl-tRNA hydrolase [Bacteroidales bacterium]MCM1069255.1 aminoacyl-tRNA hydrolase [Prevotella sp.]MCM1353762.1 aminoacyl-tRNA hydrolase [Bacteroides sp.]MCM1442170.1 aminoacyl-tRNA hydrolase [Muribaculum sp.]MCM1482533.1 aminoacyl-tRNA hydrolase [Paludibacter sp.]